MNFTDMHIHLQDYKANCATDIIENARAAGVGRMVCAATAESDWPAVAALAEKYPHTVVPAFGVHPWYAGETAAGWEHRLHKRLLSAPEALVGESGLDGLRGDQAAQKTVFSVQAALAKELRRPLVIHAVKAVAALSAFLPQMPERFMIHSFNGRTEHLRPILNAGGYVSFSASILKNRDRGNCQPGAGRPAADRNRRPLSGAGKGARTNAAVFARAAGAACPLAAGRRGKAGGRGGSQREGVYLWKIKVSAGRKPCSARKSLPACKTRK